MAVWKKQSHSIGSAWCQCWKAFSERETCTFPTVPRLMVFQSREEILLTKGTGCFQFSWDQFKDLHNSKMSALLVSRLCSRWRNIKWVLILLVGHLINWKWSCKVGLRWQLHNALRQVVWTPANKWWIYPKGVWHDPVPSGSHHNKTFRQTYEVRILKCQVFYYFITDNIFSQIIRLLMNGHQWRKMLFAARWYSYGIYHQGLTRPCEHVRPPTFDLAKFGVGV